MGREARPVFRQPVAFRQCSLRPGRTTTVSSSIQAERVLTSSSLSWFSAFLRTLLREAFFSPFPPFSLSFHFPWFSLGLLAVVSRQTSLKWSGRDGPRGPTGLPPASRISSVQSPFGFGGGPDPKPDPVVVGATEKRLHEREAFQKELKEAEASCKKEKKELKEAKKELKEAEAKVEKAEAKVEKAKKELKEAKKELKEAEAKLEKAKKELEKAEATGTKDVIKRAKHMFDMAVKGANSAQAGVDSAQAGVDSAQAGVDSAQAGVCAGRSGLCAGTSE
eukprot:g49028.t1